MRNPHDVSNHDSGDSQQGRPPLVYLVDDEISFLRASSRLLRASHYRVKSFASAEDFLKRDGSEEPGCVVLELQISGRSGLELQEALVKSEEPFPVIFVTAHGDISSSVRAMKQGAFDFLTKPVRGDELLEAVHRAVAWGAAERQTRRQKREWRARYKRLTQREREVFALAVGGMLNKEISDVLGITERTIKAHRGKLMQKMGVRSAPQLGRAVEWLGHFFQAAPALDMPRPEPSSGNQRT